jgi:hypothetical protein
MKTFTITENAISEDTWEQAHDHGFGRTKPADPENEAWILFEDDYPFDGRRVEVWDGNPTGVATGIVKECSDDGNLIILSLPSGNQVLIRNPKEWRYID